jgi:Lrp/AsnC family transcriptional regulator, leucine-responsive regulatory protein
MAVPELVTLDETDEAILDLLDQDARQPAATIAKEVELSPAAVRRRIGKLQELGVIVGFTTVLNHTRVRPAIEAFVEMTFSTADVRTVLTGLLDDHPEVREASTLAGDPDALVRLRVLDLDELRAVVTMLREKPGVTNTKTLVALGRVRHVARVR